MKVAPLAINEKDRLTALRKYEILDTEPDPAFDSMVNLAAYICKTPFAAISLVDENRQWFKATVGIQAKETPRDIAFCAHTILQDEIMVVPDAKLDERFFDNPLVSSVLNIRFYAGVPLTTDSGMNLGTLCVLDSVARELNTEQLAGIRLLANNIMAHLNLRLSHRAARLYAADMQLAASIFEAVNQAIIVTDADNKIVTVNPAFTAITGYTFEEAAGQTPRLLNSGRQPEAFYQDMWATIDATGRWSGELWSRRKNGTEYAEHLSINAVFNADGSKHMHVGIFSDITAKKQADELVWNQANFDHLTKLPNRRLFLDRMEQAVKLAHRLRQSAALLYVDLDHFKSVNDTLGHDAGDKLLIESAERMRNCVRDADTIGRMGGDEFTVVLTQIQNHEDAGNIAKNIIQALTQPFMIDGNTLNISASIGIAMYPDNGSNVNQLMRGADNALYIAKNAGRGTFRYCPDT
jgi:diguanylate cyclase (GGDEF)-like protein/PAS domain S-box-containing protein